MTADPSRYDFTDDTNTPELEEGQKRDLHQLYINHTRGLWVRKNRKDDTLEIWYDGRFHCAWKEADLIEVRLTTMLREAFEMGERKGKNDNQAALREALGI